MVRTIQCSAVSLTVSVTLGHDDYLSNISYLRNLAARVKYLNEKIIPSKCSLSPRKETEERKPQWDPRAHTFPLDHLSQAVDIKEEIKVPGSTAWNVKKPGGSRRNNRSNEKIVGIVERMEHLCASALHTD